MARGSLPAPRRRRLARLLMAFAVFAITLELVLQVGALTVSWTSARRDAGGEGGDVLCVGDSYTYGIGATSPTRSYPGALQAALRARGLDVRVTNAGWAGQSSREVLRNLPQQITARIRVLCVLVGVNDTWRRPERLTIEEARDAAADGGFSWQWRTGKLLALATRFAFGSWSRSGDGDTAPASSHEAAPGGTLVTARRTRGFGELLSYGVAKGLLAEPPPPAVTCSPEPELRQAYARMWELQRSGQLERAAVLARECASQFPASPRALGQLAQIERLQGGTAAATIRRLEAMHDAAPSGAVTDSLIQALAAVGRSEAAIALARQRIRAEPGSLPAWNVLQEQAYHLGLRDEFRSAALRTLALLGASAPEQSAHILRNYVQHVAGAEPDQAARLLVAAHLLDGNSESTRILLQSTATTLSRATVAAALAASARDDPALTAELGPLIDEAHGGGQDSGWRDVLQDHLGRIGEIARHAGAEVVILSYPFHHPEVENEQAVASRRLGARWAAIRARFDEALKSRPRSELFVPDGHCSDAGYELMAEVTAEQVAAILSK